MLLKNRHQKNRFLELYHETWRAIALYAQTLFVLEMYTKQTIAHIAVRSWIGVKKMSESANFEKWQYKTKDALPCPYCGSESVSVKHKEIRFYGWNGLGFKKHRMKAYCVCNKCGATGAPIYYDGYSDASFGYYDDEHKRVYSCGDEAIKAWNTRKPMERILERLEEKAFWTESTFDGDGYCNDDSEEAVLLSDIIEIIGEEGVI